MSGKSVRLSRNVVRKETRAIAVQQMQELFNAPFKYRLKFCMKLMFGRRKK